MTDWQPAPLRGVDHTARPTWKLKETIEFYRDVLGLKLVHTISAKGWGPKTHPDFVHFFFDSGSGSHIAFFYYFGSEPPSELRDRPYMRPAPDDHLFDATHTAWLVETEAQLQAWRHFLESKGVQVFIAGHEIIESIYFRDPNGYLIEITRKLRIPDERDASDAALTLQAAVEVEKETGQAGQSVASIEDVWRRKAALLEARDSQQPGRARTEV